MASTRSGSNQSLHIGNIALAQDDGLEGFTLNVEGDTIAVTSGGLSTVSNAGGIAGSGSFTCLETQNTNDALLGKNGARLILQWSVGGTQRLNANCILTVTRVFEDRGARKFNVDFLVDGALVTS